MYMTSIFQGVFMKINKNILFSTGYADHTSTVKKIKEAQDIQNKIAGFGALF